jgi:hypothetical protein
VGKSFSVGEIAIFKSPYVPEHYGEEVVVFSVGGCPNCGRDPVGRYEVRTQNGRRFCAGAKALHKRRPPQDWVKLCNLTDIPREVAHG